MLGRDMNEHDLTRLAAYFAPPERDPRPAAGYRDGAGGAARERPLDGGEAGPARRTPCQCGGAHHFTPAGDFELESFFKEPAVGRPDESDPDFSELNGHLANGYSNGHVVDLASRHPRLYQGGSEGNFAVAGWEGREYPSAVHPARSLGSASVADPIWESVVASPSRLKRCLDHVLPSWSSRLLWAAALLGLLLWGLGMI